MARIVIIGWILAAWAASCGGADTPAPTPTPSANPELARKDPGAGEILIRGDLSPASHGPYEFDGRYTVSFEQYAPENAKLNFSQQTSFVAILDTEAEFEGPDSIRLFEASRRTAKKHLRLQGRYFVDVTFGDFPYVIRFTPRH